MKIRGIIRWITAPFRGRTTPPTKAKKHRRGTVEYNRKAADVLANRAGQRGANPSVRARLMALLRSSDSETSMRALRGVRKYDHAAVSNLAQHATGRMRPETQAKLTALSKSDDPTTRRIAQEALERERRIRRG